MAPEHDAFTTLLQTATENPQAASEILPLVYDELRELARRRMSNEPGGHTLGATALVHEAYMRLVGDTNVQWDSKRHFFGAAAIAMKRILIERARRYGRLKHGAGRARVALDDVEPAAQGDDVDVLSLNEALERLASVDPRKSEVVHLRYFAGLSIQETAAALGLSPATVKLDWQFAKSWLLRELEKGEDAGADNVGADDGRAGS